MYRNISIIFFAALSILAFIVLEKRHSNQKYTDTPSPLVSTEQTEPTETKVGQNTLIPITASGIPSPSPSLQTPKPKASLSLVSIDFDDGFESAFKNGLPLLNQANLKTTQFIITKKFDDPAYVTVDQVLEMQAQGHEIGAHTRHHPHLSQLDGMAAQDEISGSKEDLITIGIKKVSSFAYPYGDHSSLVDQITQTAQFSTIRTTESGFNNQTSNPYALKAFVINSTTNLEEIKRWIDSAQTSGQWLILVFHRIDEPGNPISIPHQTLQAIIDYLKFKQITVVTHSQALKIIWGDTVH